VLHLHNDAKNLPLIELSKDMVRTIKRGHRWLFEDCFDNKNTKSAGLSILTYKKIPLAIGITQPDSSLRFRIICQLEAKDRAAYRLQKYIQEQWARTLLLRSSFPNENTDCFRLCNGEGDGFPGLIIDIYRHVAVIKHDHPIMETIWNRQEIAKLLQSSLPQLECVYFKRSNREQEKGEELFGKLAEQTQFRENGAIFESNIRDAAKTGFFLDQRDNRLLIKNFSRDRRVLNLFSYTGGFSLFAGLGGATQITSVDIAAPAIEAAKHNLRLNQLDHIHQAHSADAFEFLEEANKQKQLWDLVITDPPSFAPNQKALPKAVEAYTRVFTSSLKLTKAGSLFAASSCSSHLTYENFLDICRESFSKSRRVGSTIYLGGQPFDHPYPTAMSELRYLKFALFRVDDVG
jgi:23S rRNA (cytosine1962-C5)-methyltransferase